MKLQTYVLNAAGLQAINQFLTKYSVCKIPTALHYQAETERNTIMMQGHPGLIAIDKIVSKDGKAHVLSLNPEWFETNTDE